jgi:host factor-I protein
MLSATAVKVPNIQDSFLAEARRSAAHVTVFLMNGYQMRGVITQFDPYVVVLMTDSRQQVIYKHAISTITPERTIELE